MAQREISDIVQQATDNFPEAIELFFSWCGRGNERRGYCGNSRHPLPSRQIRLHPVREQLDKQIGAVWTNAPSFAARRCEHVTATVLHGSACVRELGNLSAYGSSSGFQHLSQASIRFRR